MHPLADPKPASASRRWGDLRPWRTTPHHPRDRVTRASHAGRSAGYRASDHHAATAVDGEDLAAALKRTMRGESVVSPEMSHKLLNALRNGGGATSPAKPEQDKDAPQLSPREIDILKQLTRGASNKEIARSLGIAETTVKIHVQHILRKLNLSSRVQAAVFAAGRATG
jgi:DNA-binding NarL/FixJ family response regulator